jgi:hypothetical protein
MGTYDACPEVDENAQSTHVPGAWLESAKDHLAEDGNAIGPRGVSLVPNSSKHIPVKADCANVEHAEDRLTESARSNTTASLAHRVVAQGNEIDGNAPKHGEPHRVQRDVHGPVHDGPDPAAGEQAVAREGEDGARERLRRGEAHELQDDEGADGEEDAGGLAERIVVDLRDGLLDGRAEDRGRVAHGEGEHDVEEKAGDVGESHGPEDLRGSVDGEFGARSTVRRKEP